MLDGHAAYSDSYERKTRFPLNFPVDDYARPPQGHSVYGVEYYSLTRSCAAVGFESMERRIGRTVF